MALLGELFGRNNIPLKGILLASLGLAACAPANTSALPLISPTPPAGKYNTSLGVIDIQPLSQSGRAQIQPLIDQMASFCASPSAVYSFAPGTSLLTTTGLPLRAMEFSPQKDQSVVVVQDPPSPIINQAAIAKQLGLTSEEANELPVKYNKVALLEELIHGCTLYNSSTEPFIDHKETVTMADGTKAMLHIQISHTTKTDVQTTATLTNTITGKIEQLNNQHEAGSTEELLTGTLRDMAVQHFFPDDPVAFTLSQYTTGYRIGRTLLENLFIESNFGFNTAIAEKKKANNLAFYKAADRGAAIILKRDYGIELPTDDQSILRRMLHWSGLISNLASPDAIGDTLPQNYQTQIAENFAQIIFKKGVYDITPQQQQIIIDFVRKITTPLSDIKKISDASSEDTQLVILNNTLYVIGERTPWGSYVATPLEEYLRLNSDTELMPQSLLQYSSV